VCSTIEVFDNELDNEEKIIKKINLPIFSLGVFQNIRLTNYLDGLIYSIRKLNKPQINSKSIINIP